MAVTKNTPAWWDDCEHCGYKVQSGRLCKNCGRRDSEREHTHMAYGNTDEAGNFAIVSENYQWADDRKATEREIWTQKESVYATLRACGLPHNERV